MNKNLKTFLNFPEKIENLFPNITKSDYELMDNYLENSIINYSNHFSLKLDKKLFSTYIHTLQNDRIYMDLIRINYTRDFIEKIDKSYLKNVCNYHSINTAHINFLKENEINYFNFSQIKNKKEFADCILNSNEYFKYLLHQDIHNSVLHPILVSIILKKAKKSDAGAILIQFRDIKQIYVDCNQKRNQIEMIYFIKKFFIINDREYSPIEYKIKPYIIIKCIFTIKNDFIDIDIIF